MTAIDELVSALGLDLTPAARARLETFKRGLEEYRTPQTSAQTSATPDPGATAAPPTINSNHNNTFTIQNPDPASATTAQPASGCNGPPRGHTRLWNKRFLAKKEEKHPHAASVRLAGRLFMTASPANTLCHSHQLAAHTCP